ncbi:Protein VTS1 [Fusarium oxysporum f. sp. albedinis]|nr:Protein VTS1 [Fusarium oxysporum f. sp. albedinis]
MKILSGEPSSQRHPSIKKQHRQGRETDRTGLLDQALFTLRPARKVTIIGTEQSKLIKDGRCKYTCINSSLGALFSLGSCRGASLGFAKPSLFSPTIHYISLSGHIHMETIADV